MCNWKSIWLWGSVLAPALAERARWSLSSAWSMRLSEVPVSVPKALALSTLLITLTGAAVQAAPTIFFTDLDSGPNSGGESVSGFAGAYATIYGNFFGSSQGSSDVTWNGQNCLRVVPPTGSYTGWGMPHLWYQKIIVQIGSGCTAGSGNFVVTVNGQASNSIPFTVRSSGNIYCISTTGNDSNSGKFPSSCWSTPKNAFSHMNAGDTAYWEGGLIINSGGGFGGLDWGAGGTAGNPVAMVSYPGATPQPGIQCVNGSCSSGIAIRSAVGYPSSASYYTLAGLLISGDGQALMTQYPSANHQRYVGNFWTCTGTPGAVGCVEMR